MDRISEERKVLRRNFPELMMIYPLLMRILYYWEKSREE